MKITEAPLANGRESYLVLSDSNATYRVTYCGSGDDRHFVVRLWECSCPGGQHSKMCKHVTAVIAYSNAKQEEEA